MKRFDGTEKQVEYIKVETDKSIVIDIEQRVTYIESDGTTRVYLAKGNYERIEIIMPDTQTLDVNYARDSISDYDYAEVIVGIESVDGVLYMPAETIDLVVIYEYKVSILNDKVHIVLDENIMKNLDRRNEDATLSVHKATDKDMNPSQIETVGDNYAIAVYLTIGGEMIHQLEGYANISIAVNFIAHYVYFVDEEGKTELIPSTFDEKENMVNFFTGHLSTFMITQNEPGTDPDSISYLPIAIIAAIIILISAFIFFKIRKK